MSGFKDSIVGGVGNLIRSWIQSVPFVSGSQGWRISKDGTAEFNSVTIRGGVVVTNGSQMFVYSSNPPANGTLVFSISPTSGTDAYGNNYTAGFQNYGGSKIGIVNGTFAITTPFGDILQLQWDTINFVLSLNDAIPLNFVVSQEMCHLGVDGFVIDAGKITAVKPGTGTSYNNPAQPEVWTNAILTNANFTVAGLTNPLRYRKMPDETVLLDGEVLTTGVGPWPGNTTLFTLPSGYMPSQNMPFITRSDILAAAGGDTVNVLSTGGVQNGVAFTAANQRLWFTNCRFPIN